MDESITKESPSHLMKAGRKKPPAVEAQKSEAADSSRTFEAVFLEHWTHIYRLLVGLVGDPAEAEDLAVETFMRLYQQPPAGGVRGAAGPNLGGWLHRVATNLGLHSIRSFKRRERYELSAGKDALDAAADVHPAERLLEAEERRLARTVLGQMNERQAQLLVMRYSRMAYKEVAAALGLAPTSIGPLLVRAEREFERRYRGTATAEEEK